jgi:hypothetical protein
MKATKVKKPQIALRLPTIVALLLIFVRHVIDMMTKNAAMFVNIVPPLSDVGKHADDLEAAEALAKSHAKGAVPDRNAKKRIVETDMMLLKAYVYGLALAAPLAAANLIAGAGMSEKNPAFRLKLAFEAILGPNPLEVILRAKAETGKAFYEWQYSSDGKSWLDLRPTNEASTTLTVPAAGTYQFRYRATVKKLTGEWSQEFALVVPAH